MNSLSADYYHLSESDWDRRINRAREMVRGCPNEKEWMEALEGACKCRRDAYQNAKEALRKAFENNGCIVETD